ncbi:MAG: GGDEF domain-containing protein, partial [Bacilli bacterium]
QDNYVLVAKNKDKYANLEAISNIKIGVLKNEMDLINQYINTSVSFESYENILELFEELKDENKKIDAIAIPKMVYLEKIISDETLNIVYNISDLKEYYVLSLGKDVKLNSIISKYFIKWNKENYDELYKKNLNKNYFAFKKIDETAKAKFKGRSYTYGFVSNPPYDILYKGKLIGLNSTIIKNFANLANIELSIKKYNNVNGMLQSFNENNLDFVFNNYSSTEYKMDTKISTSFYDEKIVVVSNLKNNVIVNSLNSIKDKEILVVADTKIEQYLSNNQNKTKKYNNLIDLLDNVNNDSIIALDYDSYYFYSKNKLENFKIDYNFTLKDNYNYVMRDIAANKIFNDYLDFYLSFINEKEYTNSTYIKLFDFKMEKNPNRLLTLLLILVIILISLIVVLKKLLFKKKKKKKGLVMSKTDKLRYVDVLTSLKNRNYLNDHIEIWDDSEVYPQTIVIVDLNNIAYINDNYGHQEGDNVIKEAANILIKNQIQNTEIIRTNGNEFLIYMVGYDEKQVISHVRKLIKELKELAHGFGAAAGYSMINDAIKTIDDAVNEATLDMKNNKEELSN